MTDHSSTVTEFNLESIQTSASEEDLDDFAAKLQSIAQDLRGRIVSDSKLEDLFESSQTLTSDDDQKRQKPEELTKGVIITELLEYLGYPYADQELNTPAEDEDIWVDYSVPLSAYPNIGSSQLLIEAEPINKNLDQTKHGKGQVRSWLHHEPFESNLGIATDGFQWVLLKKDPDTHTVNEVEQCDLTAVLQALFENISTGMSPVEEVLDDTHYESLESFYRAFEFQNFTNVAAGVQSAIRQKKKEISKKFYNQYIRLVFGIKDEDTEGRDTERCLVGEGIDAPPGAPEDDRRLFAVKLMNRLIFIQFLEDTGVVADGLMADMRSRHEDGNHFTDCYTTFVEPLIYDVFNTPPGPGNRPDKIVEDELYSNIPYLNGGLFRATLPNEKDYTVSDSVLLEILDMLEEYNFSMAGRPDELDPSILGTVFEQTINYLAGEEGAQKDLGAYYTPDSITRFTAVRSVKDDLLSSFKTTLREQWNWREGELAQYEEVYDLIDALSSNQDVIEDLLDDVDSFYVLDPACGSGHFLTSALHELLSVRRALYEKHEESPRTQGLKKQTILRNLYGVDIVGPGVEITKLRLWLSIMAELSNEEIEDMERGELALPNIAFNIREGNSLIGYTDTGRLRIEEDDDHDHQQTHVGEWGSDSIEQLVEERQEKIDQYKKLYGEEAHRIQDEIEANDEQYNQRLNEKLVDDLRDAGVSFEHDIESVEAPELPSDALDKVSIRFDEPIDDKRKEELEEKFRTDKGMRINSGKSGYVSMTLFHRYLTATPDDRLNNILGELKENIGSYDVERYLTVEDIKELEYLHWPLEFYEVFDNGGFDVVIGNPPYGIDLTAAESALNTYPDENHSSMVFASRSEQLVAGDGQIAFVVPKALTYAYRWQDARSHLLDSDLGHLIDLREAFDGVKQEQIILMYSPEEGTDDDVVVGRRETDGENGDVFFEQNYDQSSFDTDGFFMWVDEDSDEVLTKLSGYDTFANRDFADATKGLDRFKQSLTGDSDDLLAYRGDDVGQFRFVGHSYLDDSVQNRSDFHLAGHGDQKVVFQRILAHVTDPTDRVVIQSAIDYDGACVPDTAIHATPNEGSLELLCGLLNSSLFAWYAYNRIYNRAIRSMDLTPIYFGRFPAPPEMDSEAIERIETQTERLHGLEGESQNAVMDAYEKLDKAVFDLYQLTDEERSVIVKETPPREKTLVASDP